MRLSLTRPIAIDFLEAARYLSNRRQDAALSRDLAEAAGLLLEAARPAAAAVVLPLVREGGALLLGSLALEGTAIRRHLAGCQRCAVLGVTLGFSVDRLISSAGYTNAYRALLYDACAAAAVEDLADHAQERLREQLLSGRGSLTRRFSPGYGDFPLSAQPSLLALLDAQRAIGLTVGNSLLLSPIKSVTALVGVADGEPAGFERAVCTDCSMGTACPYSRITRPR